MRIAILPMASTAAILLWSIGAFAQGTATTFRIVSLFSNLDGSIQFIRLKETAGLDGQGHLAGLKLTSTRNGTTREYTFPSDISPQTANVSIVVAVMPAGQPYLPVEFPGGGWYCCYPPDFRMPDRFLFTDGGVVDFAGVDRVDYATLPTDGATGIDRGGAVVAATLPGPRCPVASPPKCPNEQQISQTPVTAIEYFNAALGHYFVSASAPDLDALESGRIPGWQRTGFTFPVGANASAIPGAVPPIVPGVHVDPVCRFYLPPPYGDSHFLSASADECAIVRDRYPGFVLESSAAFYATLPDLATGACPPPYDDLNDNVFTWLPVYRLWNGRADSNHRYTINSFVRTTMIAQGYVSEGYGDAGVAFCVPAKNLP